MTRMLDVWLKEGYHEVPGTDSLNTEVEPIEGIGPVYATKLAKAGIISLMDLWMGSTVIISNRTGIDTELIVRWQKMADISRVDGVGMQYAELVVSAGIDTVQRLASSEVDEVTKRIEKAMKKYPAMVRRKPGKKTIEKWINNALTINMMDAPYTGKPGKSDEYKEGW